MDFSVGHRDNTAYMDTCGGGLLHALSYYSDCGSSACK